MNIDTMKQQELRRYLTKMPKIEFMVIKVSYEAMKPEDNPEDLFRDHGENFIALMVDVFKYSRGYNGKYDSFLDSVESRKSYKKSDDTIDRQVNAAIKSAKKYAARVGLLG